MANTLIIVEGPQDSEFVSQLLKRKGFNKVSLMRELDESFCLRLLNTSYPIDGDLYARMPTPMYLRRNTDWVAIRSAGGETPKLVTALTNALQRLRPQPTAINAIGLIRDADDRTANESFEDLIQECSALKSIDGFEIVLPTKPGTITNGTPRFGTYILPDNSGTGALETLLQDCGNVVYTELMKGARNFVNSVNVTKLDRKDGQLFKKPMGPTKATVACVADILKPGMSIQTSIDQNRWVCEMTESLPRIAPLSAFLTDLVGVAS